jgi:hypothetical protein
MFMSSINLWRSGLMGASRTEWDMVRLLVEEARHRPLTPNEAQCMRDDRLLISASTAGAFPRSGFVLRPYAVMPEYGSQ